jgi:hypothetical protein
VSVDSMWKLLSVLSACFLMKVCNIQLCFSVCTNLQVSLTQVVDMVSFTRVPCQLKPFDSAPIFAV